MKRLISAGVAMLIGGLVFGQPGENTLRFEAADIRPSPAAVAGTNSQKMRGGLYRSGRYEVHSATMLDLVRTAYNVDADKVTGGPAWMDQDRFDILAKAPGDSFSSPSSTPEKMRAMLRSLLAERFGLVVHEDTKPRAAYAIRQGKKVLMKRSGGSGGSGCKPVEPVIYTCRNVSMAELPDQLRNMGFATKALNGIPVVDQTELRGGWDFDIGYPQNSSPEGMTIFAAFEKQLGLKLEPTKIPTAVIAIDRVNEKPADSLPGTTMAAAPPLEFEVADIRRSDPDPPPGAASDCFYCPGGRLHISRFTMSDLIATAWNLNGSYDSRVIGLPKSLEKVYWDVIARVSTMIPVNPANLTSISTSIGQPAAQQVDFDSVRIMLQALLRDRFKLALHEETRQLNGYALVAVKPKLRPAGPDDGAGCKEGPGPDGKDPRLTNPQARRLITCLNMTVAEFAAEVANRAGDYFAQYPGRIVDATNLEGKYDFTVNFSPLAMATVAGAASDTGYGITLPDAFEKQLGLRLEARKNPGMVLVVDHVEEKPTQN